jgi:hypothetical protein
MDLLEVGLKVLTLVLSYPWEKHMKNDHAESDRNWQAIKENLNKSLVPIKSDIAGQECPVCHTGSPETMNLESPPLLKPTSQADLIRMEQEGDYCLSCVPSKHLMRAHDAMKDAINIFNSKKEFTDVAEEKLQNAVYELNGAEKDLELARVPEEIKPAVDEFRNQVRKLRNYMRQDQSGLEVATILPEKKDELKKALDTAFEVNGILIKYGYDLAKVQLQQRARTKLESQL